jgi:signal transduction histidine kinase
MQDEDLIFKCLQEGAQDYIMKNELNKSTLQKAIIHSIERYELQRKSKKLTEQLDSFAHTIAHNLRHPLQTILVISETVKELYKEDKAIDPTPYLDEIERKLFNLSEMVNHLLYYSSSTGKVKEKFELVNLSDCVKKALDNLKGMSNYQNASIKYENLPSVYGDESLITVLFQNLIENSIKYRSVYPPQIEIEADKVENDAWEISITDNGIGIAENDMNLLFDAFKRPNRTKNYDGFGIGLATCKRIIELHNGKIWVEPKKEKGATIHFTIPDAEK